MTVELHRRRLGCETWEAWNADIAMSDMTEVFYDRLARDKAQSWSLFDPQKKRRVMISKITYERQDPSDEELRVLKVIQAQRLAFIQSVPAPHVPELENWRRPGTRRVTKGPAPCRAFGKR